MSCQAVETKSGEFFRSFTCVLEFFFAQFVLTQLKPSELFENFLPSFTLRQVMVLLSDKFNFKSLIHPVDARTIFEFFLTFIQHFCFSLTPTDNFQQSEDSDL